MTLQVCVNGVRKVLEHPGLSADELVSASECARAVEAGADSIHVHPKDAEGEDSLHPADVARWIVAFRRACPGVPLGVTTGAWAASSQGERTALIGAWESLPDFASVNWHEQGAEELVGHLFDRGIGVEAGLWTVDAARTWAQSRQASRCLRVLVELPDIPPEEVPVRAEEILSVVAAAHPRMSVLLHGEERSAWSALDFAAERGLDTRVGLEDTLRRPDGSAVSSNEELVRIHLGRVRDHLTGGPE
ncbi:3-keto-5-aminohexanoate cleavage protein [Arthrobacter sp.]|uniref:3-keto-5-aminohexanoate cleavage protein n=1 Tax=Arthrobacter sp. TaxID=1667 RepID=UPI00259058F4|nr:3-keto-5-aminohexanoate cleavage protein [Arthrobacter sp.]